MTSVFKTCRLLGPYILFSTVSNSHIFCLYATILKEFFRKYLYLLNLSYSFITPIKSDNEHLFRCISEFNILFSWKLLLISSFYVKFSYLLEIFESFTYFIYSTVCKYFSLFNRMSFYFSLSFFCNIKHLYLYVVLLVYFLCVFYQ